MSGDRWVHLYEFPVGGEPAAGAWGRLSGDERARAARILDPVRRMRFVARRAALREILGEYAEWPEVQFSTSDSGDVAVVAVAARPVGVDIELEKARRSIDRIAERMFAPDEREALAALDGAARRGLFHRCWVGKEAYAKGIGRGLAMRFDEFSVASALRSPAGTGAVGAGWTVVLGTHGERHLAVAATGDDWEVEHVG